MTELNPFCILVPDYMSRASLERKLWRDMEQLRTPKDC